MRFITSVIHKVEDITAATDFFCTALEFQQQEVVLNGVVIDNGAVSIRLLATDYEEPAGFLNLECRVNRLAEETKELLLFPGIKLIADSIQVNQQRIESHFQCPHGLSLVLCKKLNEDDLDILPLLPISLDWSVEAEECIRQVLRVVPLDFRQLARERVTEQAEMLAGEQGLISVDLDFAIQALAKATPLFQHSALKDALLARGVDPGNYFKENC